MYPHGPRPKSVKRNDKGVAKGQLEGEEHLKERNRLRNTPVVIDKRKRWISSTQNMRQ